MKKGVEDPKNMFVSSSAPPGSEINNGLGGTGNNIQGVHVRNAVKSYGVGSRRSIVLNGLDMDVKKGTM